MLGDTAYMDWGRRWDLYALNHCYEEQSKIKAYRELIAKVPTLAIWDDHDCGYNDIRGAEVPELVKQSRAQFDYWTLVRSLSAALLARVDKVDKLYRRMHIELGINLSDMIHHSRR